jgi:hypothetical protein
VSSLIRVAERVFSDWMCREHQEYLQSISRQIHANGFLSKLSAEMTVEFLKLNRFQAGQVTGLLTGYL